MNNSTLITISFIFFILLFIVIGLYATTKKKDTIEDYLVADRNVNPWLISQSVFATANSGYMFIGLIGWTYIEGVKLAWISLAWFIGDIIAWFLVYKKLRQISEQTNSNTIGSFLSQSGSGSRLIAIFSALITIIFLGTYASAQLVAGSKALQVVFGWNYSSGIILGAILVLTYCFSGGIRASIWTDTVQSLMMMGAMFSLLSIAISSCGGVNNLWTSLGNIDPNLTQIFPQDHEFNFILFFLGWLIMGFGVVGQPQIMIRAMAIDSVKNIGLAFSAYSFTTIIFSIMAIMMGLTARVLIPNLLAGGDTELAFPILATQLLPAPLVGFVLAGILSSATSTADSIILSCSAALSQDIFPKAQRSYQLTKWGTFFVTLMTMIIALTGEQNVRSVVIFSWSILASSMAPLLILRIMQRPIRPLVAIGMMGLGFIIPLIWKLNFPCALYATEIIPGMGLSVLLYLISERFYPSQKTIK